MAFSPENSAIKVTKSLEERIAGASSQTEVQEILRQAAIDQKLVHRDWDPNILTPNEPGTQPRGFAKAVIDGSGKKLIFEGSTELEVEQRLGEYFRSLNLAHPEQSAATTQEQPRSTDGRFVASADDPTARIESDLVARALEAQGVSMSDLQAVSAQRQQQEWSSAVEEFKAHHTDWIGGEENKNLIGQIIIANPDAFNGLSPLESLEKAYQHAVENGLLVEPPEVAARDRIASANSVEEIRNIVRPGGSGFFGR
jgi:hypothetical protein